LEQKEGNKVAYINKRSNDGKWKEKAGRKQEVEGSKEAVIEGRKEGINEGKKNRMNEGMEQERNGERNERRKELGTGKQTCHSSTL